MKTLGDNPFLAYEILRLDTPPPEVEHSNVDYFLFTT